MFHSGFYRIKQLNRLSLLLFFSLGLLRASAQAYEVRSVLYNTLIGGISGGIGSLINKHKGEKPVKTFARGFAVGSCGGVVMYAGKKMNRFVATEKSLGYAWLSRAVFSAGNSVVENASANRTWYTQWHYDLGFIRFQYSTTNPSRIQPMLMPAYFGAFMFTAFHGHLDVASTLKSGTFIFSNVTIDYAPYLVGSTTGNSVLFVDSLQSYQGFHDIFAHEMVHTCQFQELSGINYFFQPLTTKWKEKSPRFKKLSRYVYGDLNYGLMLANYFILQGSIFKSQYCHNFLENEAEILTTGRLSCPRYHP